MSYIETGKLKQAFIFKHRKTQIVFNIMEKAIIS